MKLSKRLFEVVTQKQEAIKKIALTVSRMEVNCSHLPDHFLVNNVDWYKGVIAGHESAIEAILHAHGCYNGYREMKSENTTFGVDYHFKQYDLGKAS
jgi:hypothetical protein